jgi:hypothetical protein
LACTWRGSAGSSSTSERQRPWIGHSNECHHLPRRTQRRAELQPFGRAASLLLRPHAQPGQLLASQGVLGLERFHLSPQTRVLRIGRPKLNSGAPKLVARCLVVLQRIPFMAGVCSLVRRAGRLHFIGRHLEDRHYDPPGRQRSPPQRPRRRVSLARGNAPRRQRRSRLRSPVSNASRSAPEARLVGSGTSGTPTPNIGCRELELRCPRAFGGARDERKGFAAGLCGADAPRRSSSEARFIS